MANAPGRDQVEPMERLLRLVILLSAKSNSGVSASQLAETAGYPQPADSHPTALRRDLAHLRAGGWDITNVAPDGDDGHYVLSARDNRLALLLTPGERVALDHALQDANADVMTPPEALADLERAVERHCLTRFSYKGTRRTVHPYTLYSGPSGWMLHGREVASGVVKEFVVTRMADEVEIDQPGTAEVVSTVPHPGLDPMEWLIDAPLEVALLTTNDYCREVLRVLPGAVVTSRDGLEVRISLRVTNRAAFRSRLYELGVRVRVLGPSEVRDEVLADLGALAESAH